MLYARAVLFYKISKQPYFIVVQIDVVNYGIIHATYRENKGKCRLTLAKETVGSTPTYVASLLAKNSPFTENFNKQ